MPSLGVTGPSLVTTGAMLVGFAGTGFGTPGSLVLVVNPPGSDETALVGAGAVGLSPGGGVAFGELSMEVEPGAAEVGETELVASLVAVTSAFVLSVLELAQLASRTNNGRLSVVLFIVGMGVFLEEFARWMLATDLS